MSVGLDLPPLDPALGSRDLGCPLVPRRQLGSDPADLVRTLGPVAGPATDQGHPVNQVVNVGGGLGLSLEFECPV